MCAPACPRRSAFGRSLESEQYTSRRRGSIGGESAKKIEPLRGASGSMSEQGGVNEGVEYPSTTISNTDRLEAYKNSL
jgi:hypothetical protein